MKYIYIFLLILSVIGKILNDKSIDLNNGDSWIDSFDSRNTYLFYSPLHYGQKGSLFITVKKEYSNDIFNRFYAYEYSSRNNSFTNICKLISADLSDGIDSTTFKLYYNSTKRTTNYVAFQIKSLSNIPKVSVKTTILNELIEYDISYNPHYIDVFSSSFTYKFFLDIDRCKIGRIKLIFSKTNYNFNTHYVYEYSDKYDESYISKNILNFTETTQGSNIILTGIYYKSDDFSKYLVFEIESDVDVKKIIVVGSSIYNSIEKEDSVVPDDYYLSPGKSLFISYLLTFYTCNFFLKNNESLVVDFQLTVNFSSIDGFSQSINIYECQERETYACELSKSENFNIIENNIKKIFQISYIPKTKNPEKPYLLFQFKPTYDFYFIEILATLKNRSDSDSNSGSMSIGVILGIIFGSIIIVVLIIIILYIFCFKKKDKMDMNEQTDSNEPLYPSNEK